VLALIRDITKVALDAGGPRTVPARTLDAYRAVTSTAREFLPQLAKSNKREDLAALTPALLRTLFERMGSTYVKLGQFIASSPTLFPKEYVVEFQKCLDQTDPLPWPVIKQVIEQELGPLHETFSKVNAKPLASASIAQVHAAKLRSTGEDVVIKVQKPGIDQSLKADLGFVYVAARILEFVQPDFERTSLSAVASDIRESMLEELDFLKEARNTVEFRQFLQDNDLLDQATAPHVYMEHTTERVFTMQRLDGVSMLDENAISKITKTPEMGTNTIITALNIWSMSVTSMPWFHADVHAGNLLLLRDGRVGFIDFGIVGRISQKVFEAVNELSAALAFGDSYRMAVALTNMGATDDAVDIDKFSKDIDRLIAKISTSQSATVTVTSSSTSGGGASASIDIDESEITDLLLELVEITENNGLKLPREFGLLVKQSLYFDRYLKILAPNVDVLNDTRVMMGGKPRESEIDNKQQQYGAAVNGSSSSSSDVIDANNVVIEVS